MAAKRIFAFVAASALLHAGLLLAWPGPPKAERVLISSGAPLQLALAPPVYENKAAAETEQPADESQAVDEADHEAPRSPASESPTTNQLPAPAPLPAQLKEPVQDAFAEAIVASGPTAERGPSTATDPVGPPSVSDGEVRARLHEAFETHFHYPPLARRRGWEGEVVVGVRVEGDGRLSAIDVVSSSGYRVLDMAAVDSLKRLARLRDSQGLPPAGVEFEVPVRYRLIDVPA